MRSEYQRVAEVLADARAEAAEWPPSTFASINSIIKRLARMYAENDPGFDPDEFRVAANYRGIADGSTRESFLPHSD